MQLRGLALALVASGAACWIGLGGPSLGPSQKIKQWGYSIRIIEDWDSLAPAPEERHVVGKWKPDTSKMEKRGNFMALNSAQFCELSIVRIATQGTTDAQGPEADEKRKKENEGLEKARIILGKNFEKIYNPKSIDDYIDGKWEGASKRSAAKQVKAGKLTGDLMEFGSSAHAITVAVFKKDGIEWAVIYKSFEEDYKKTWQEIYLKSIQSFTLFEAEGRPDAIASTTDISKLKGEEKRKAIKAKIAGNPGWYALDTKNYVFLTNCDDRGFMTTLTKDIETVRAKVYEKMFVPRNTEESLSIVRVLDTESDYYQYGGPRGSAGFFNPKNGELVLFTEFSDVTKKNSKAYCKSVMYHEAFHQYIHYAVGDVSPHSWFNEGHGDYFAGLTVSGGNVSFGTFDWRVSFLKRHLAGKNDLVPLRSLIRLPQSEYYSNAGLKYAQGWAFIYYLRSVCKDPRAKKILDTYFTHLADNVAAFKSKKKEGEDSGLGGESIPGIPGITIVNYEDKEKVEQILSDAVDKAFEGIDLDKLERDFAAWVNSICG